MDRDTKQAAEPADHTGDGEGICPTLTKVERRVAEACRKRLARAATGERPLRLSWQDVLRRSEILRARRVSELRATRVHQESRDHLPEEAGSYHPGRVALLVFEALGHVQAGYLALQLEQLDRLGELTAFVDAVRERFPETTSSPRKPRKSPKPRK